MHDIVEDSTPSIALPDTIGSVAFSSSPTAIRANWSSLPGYAHLILSQTSESHADVRLSHAVDASRSFIETVAQTGLALDLSTVPGVRPEWRHDPAATRNLLLSAQTGNDDSALTLRSDIREQLIP